MKFPYTYKYSHGESTDTSKNKALFAELEEFLKETDRILIYQSICLELKPRLTKMVDSADVF